jgi:hypothetical protein
VGGSITATWSGSYTRAPLSYAAGYPPLAPLAVPVSNTAGQWLFAVVSWRQDAGVAGTLQYPSTVTVCDDAHNFWIPLTSGQPQTGIVRCAVWMAPAARAAQYVFVSPTAYQAALGVFIAEVTADCPWYTVALQAAGYVNQADSFSFSATLPNGVFSLAAVAFDNTMLSGALSIPGWTAGASQTIINGTDRTGDLENVFVYATGSGSTLTITGSATGNMDWAAVAISVHGVTDVLAFPYSLPLENWPVLITEIAAGAVINANALMLNGTADWTPTNATIAAVTWPAWNPWPYYQTLITQSLAITPSGSAVDAKIDSEQEAVSPVVRYQTLAWVYSQAGYANCAASIDWFTSGGSYISTSNGTSTDVPGGAWTLLSLPAAVFPPATAAFGAVSVAEIAPSGDVPSSAVLYVGYAGFGPADSYEGTPADEIAWTDFSSRNYTETAISVSRGIQYEQQSLEAGTMTVALANNDFELMYGNTESSFWPTIGDTDVPVRLRAVWPGSITPYYVLFSGFTDDIDFSWNDELRYSYASVQASDVWSRLTQQMLGAAEQDVLEDSPVAYFTCSLSGANLAPGGVTTVASLNSPEGTGTATASFSGSGIALAGDPGVSCWQSTSSGNADTGIGLGYFPSGGAPALPSVSGGVTLEFWMSPIVPTGSQPTTTLVVCTCWAGKGPSWTISISNSSGAGGSTASITVYDKSTGAATTTSIGSVTFLGADSAPGAAYFAVTFTQTSLTVVLNPGGVVEENVTVSCNLSETITGFSWGGNVTPGTISAAPGGASYGFMEIAVYGIALYDYLVPPARLASHYATAFSAYPLEIDTARLARVAGWAGFTPVLAMRCQDLSSSSELVTASVRDLDGVTAATDTSGQVVSSYFTNIAQSTLAFLLADGPGNLIYRRRLEADNRAPGQWALGENAAIPLNSNTLNESASLSPWVAENSATLTSSSATVTPLFYPYCALFHGNGSVANPQIAYGSTAGVPVTPGDWYQYSGWLYSPQGFGNGTSSGSQLFLQWLTSGLSVISSVNSGVTAMAAGSVTYLQTGAIQAPATAAYAALFVVAIGTPASTVQFYAADVVLAAVAPVLAGGAGATAPEAPYPNPGRLLSSDRAQLFNQAILTQYGPNTQSTFTGTFISFTPSSGVVVTIGNEPSIALRGQVPYTATIYLDNTAQALPYYLVQPSIEDFGNWIVQTLGSPLFRPLTVKITPAATPQSLLTGLGAEVGDTFTFRRRHLLNPEVQIVTYCSKLSHKIKIDEEGGGQWTTSYELSPFPQGNILAAGDVVHGCLTGGNLAGW